MRVLIHNQKGGVGKTTTVANLGAALLHGGHADRVLLVDGDPQLHLTSMLAPEAAAQPTTVAVADEPGLWLRAASIDDALSAENPPGSPAGWVLYDSAPGWTEETAAVMAQADLILCPVEPDFLGLSGVGQLLARMDQAGIPRGRLRLLPCRLNTRLSLHNEVCDRLRARFGALVLPMGIRTSVRIAEAAGQRLTVFGHAPGSAGCTDYALLADALSRTAIAGHVAA